MHLQHFRVFIWWPSFKDTWRERFYIQRSGRVCPPSNTEPITKCRVWTTR